MVIGVTGPHGNLGSELVRRGCVPLDCDVTDERSVIKALQGIDPDVVINCAALMSVDQCEKEPKRAFDVNVRGLANLRWCFPKRLIHISTSYVFDGRRGPYSESFTRYQPVQNYGWTKLAGETVLRSETQPYTIVRTAGLFGGCRPDFVGFVLDSLRNEMEIPVTTRLYINPTYIPHLAEALILLADREQSPKVVNVVGSRVLNRYEFSLMIADVFGLDVKLLCPSEDVPGWVAGRPENAGLKTDLAVRLGLPIYDPIVGLQEMREKLGVFA